MAATDAAATSALWNYNQREPFERGLGFVCENDTIQHTAASWVKSPPANACTIDIKYPPANASCWSGHSRPNPCNLASIHTHPYFTEADRGTMCHTHSINEYWAKQYNNGGMEFSWDDNSADLADGVDGYLGVSDRSCARANRQTSGFGADVVAGSCTRVPIPHKKWSKP